MKSDIDVVITWVNNNDPLWQKEYFKYLISAEDKESSGRQRFENLNSLHYIFRGIDRFMPWVRKIHFVTANQTPSWLNIKHPKLNLVAHKKIFPNEKDLPTFNACAIEMCFSNIPDLAEMFIYFNDDTFVLNKAEKSRFFENGMPKDFLALRVLNHDGIFSHILHSNMQLIDKLLIRKMDFIVKNIFKIFSPKYGFLINLRNLLLLQQKFSLFQIYHHPQPLLKQNIIEIEERFPEVVKKTRSSRFKNATDINQYVFRYVNLLKGDFVPYYPHDVVCVSVKNINDFEDKVNQLRGMKKIAFVCFNEHPNFDYENYDKFKSLINGYLNNILPDKSSYEV
jgi:hypothetical protein